MSAPDDEEMAMTGTQRWRPRDRRGFARRGADFYVWEEDEREARRWAEELDAAPRAPLAFAPAQRRRAVSVARSETGFSSCG